MKKNLKKDCNRDGWEEIGVYLIYLMSLSTDIPFDSDYGRGIRWVIENISEYIKENAPRSTKHTQLHTK